MRKTKQPAPVTQVGTIDLTPTWRGIMPMLIAGLIDGTDQGRRIATEELFRLANMVDEVNRETKKSEDQFVGPLSIAASVLSAFGICESSTGGINNATDLAKRLAQTGFSDFCLTVDCMYGDGTDRASVISVFFGRSDDALATCTILPELNGFTIEMHG